MVNSSKQTLSTTQRQLTNRLNRQCEHKISSQDTYNTNIQVVTQREDSSDQVDFRKKRFGLKTSSYKMSTPIRPSTPVAKTPASIPQTGTWRHPKMDEIVKRQNASSFTDRNMMNIIYNVGSMVAVFVLTRSLWNAFPTLFLDGQPFQPYANYFVWAIDLVLVYNIAMACRPLLRPKDDMSDIPLTPAQRKLLGLPPSSAPPTPGSHYITPPRYARTPTPLSGSPSGNGAYSGSPLAGRGSPLLGSISGSPFSPGASPLLQRAMGGVSSGSRRHSYGSPSALGPAGSRLSTAEAPGTPTPASKGTGIGLNNKWLYDKGRRNSGSAQLYA